MHVVVAQSDTSPWPAVSAIAVLTTAVIAGWSLAGSFRDSRERTRPLITAELEVGPSFVHGAVYLVVTNYGQTAARDVQATFDPAPAQEDPKSAGHHIHNRYKHAIEVVAPGQRLVNLCRQFVDGKNVVGDSFPEESVVTVRYWGGRHWLPLTRSKRLRRMHQDSFILRLGVHDWEHRVNPGDTNDSTRRQNQALESIAWQLWEK